MERAGSIAPQVGGTVGFLVSPVGKHLAEGPPFPGECFRTASTACSKAGCIGSGPKRLRGSGGIGKPAIAM